MIPPVVDRRDRRQGAGRDVTPLRAAEAPRDRQSDPSVERTHLTAVALATSGGHAGGDATADLAHGRPAAVQRMAPTRILAVHRLVGNRAVASTLHRARPINGPTRAPSEDVAPQRSDANTTTEAVKDEATATRPAATVTVARADTATAAERRKRSSPAGTAPRGRRPGGRPPRAVAPQVPPAPVGAHAELPPAAPRRRPSGRRSPAGARGPPAARHLRNARRAKPRPRGRSPRTGARGKGDPAARATAVAASIPTIRPRPATAAPVRPRPATPAPVALPTHTAPSPGSTWLAALVARTAAAGQAAIRRIAGDIGRRVASAESGAIARARAAAAAQRAGIAGAAGSARSRAIAAAAASLAMVGAAEAGARAQITAWHAGATARARQAVADAANQVRTAGTTAATNAVAEVGSAAGTLRGLAASWGARARGLAASGGGGDREIADARREAGSKTVAEGVERLTGPLRDAAAQVQGIAAEVRRGFVDQTTTAVTQVRSSLPATIAQLDQHRDQGLAGVSQAAGNARREVVAVQAAVLAGITQQQRAATRSIDAGLRRGEAAIRAGAARLTKAVRTGAGHAVRALAEVADRVGAAVVRRTFTMPAAQRQAPLILAPLRTAAAKATGKMRSSTAPQIQAIHRGGQRVAASLAASGASASAGIRATGASGAGALMAAGVRGASGIRQVVPSVTTAGNGLVTRAQAALSQSVSQLQTSFTGGVTQVRTQLQQTVRRGEAEAAATFGELQGAVSRAMAEAEARVRADREKSWLEKAADAVGSFLKKWGPMILAVVAGVLVAVILTPFVGPLGPVIGGMIVGAVAGGVASAVGYLADVAINDKPFSWKELGKNVLIGVVTGAIGGAIGGYVAGALKNAALPLLAKVGIQTGTDVGSAVALQVGANVLDGNPDTKWDDGLLQAGALALGVSVVSQGYSYRKGDLYGGSRPTPEVSPHPPADAQTPADVVNAPPTALADPPNLAAAAQEPAGLLPPGREPAGLLPPGREPAGLLPAPDSGPVRPNADGTPRPAGWETVERGAFFVDENLAKSIQSGKANLGRPGDLGWVMPATDAASVRTPADAARYTGMAPMAQRAQANGQPIFEVNFPLDSVSVRAPTAADAGGFPHWMPGGHTAVALEGGGGMLMNPTREAVFNGGVAPPAGTQITRIDPDGGRTIVHVF